jgi:hypothetical protein
MFGCSHLGYIQHYTLPEETGCSHPAGRTEDMRSPAQLAHCSSFGIQAVHIHPRIAGSSVLVERIVLLAGKNSRPGGSCLLVEDCCSSSFAVSAVRGSPPAQQGRLPKS